MPEPPSRQMGRTAVFNSGKYLGWSQGHEAYTNAFCCSQEIQKGEQWNNHGADQERCWACLFLLGTERAQHLPKAKPNTHCIINRPRSLELNCTECVLLLFHKQLFARGNHGRVATLQIQHAGLLHIFACATMQLHWQISLLLARIICLYTIYTTCFIRAQVQSLYVYSCLSFKNITSSGWSESAFLEASFFRSVLVWR